MGDKFVDLDTNGDEVLKAGEAKTALLSEAIKGAEGLEALTKIATEKAKSSPSSVLTSVSALETKMKEPVLTSVIPAIQEITNSNLKPAEKEKQVKEQIKIMDVDGNKRSLLVRFTTIIFKKTLLLKISKIVNEFILFKGMRFLLKNYAFCPQLYIDISPHLLIFGLDFS